MKSKHTLGISQDSDPTSSLRWHADRPLALFFTLVPGVLPETTRRAPGFEKECLLVSMTPKPPAVCQRMIPERETLLCPLHRRH